ncbi:uroporphyrinogen decarboxylase [Temperatibacter marinus]|uniref:Uroporphyrinogen decarboxylase n=1 Tax=Temperatibacter marinus TaxID=1456591 RepID=A0AA52H9Y0_9PROT|nr:uroporphyrinogen decarboxylase [Temperatibacter marinus]WND03666.1 uroporphyrinogen decarboxylase [Temperatibacter marinus]
MTKRLLNVLQGKKEDQIPFWFMRQAGRYLPEYREVRATCPSFMEFCYTPAKAAEVTLQPIRRYGMDGAILFADILVVPDGLGQKVWFETGKGPQLEPVHDAQTLAALSLDGFHQRVGNVYETLARLKQDLPKETTLIGFAGAPWTVATYMLEGAGSKDHATAKKFGYMNPDLMTGLLDLLVESTAEYLIKQIDAGADAVQIFDSWAGSLSEVTFRDWVIAPTVKIIEKVRAAHPETPIIGFPRLAGPMSQDYLSATKVDCIGLDTSMSLQWAKDNLQSSGVCVQGNLDPQLVVAGGARMLEEAERVLESFKYGRHIFNLGHGFTPDCPPEHVAALSEFIQNYRR